MNYYSRRIIEVNLQFPVSKAKYTPAPILESQQQQVEVLQVANRSSESTNTTVQNRTSRPSQKEKQQRNSKLLQKAVLVPTTHIHIHIHINPFFPHLICHPSPQKSKSKKNSKLLPTPHRRRTRRRTRRSPNHRPKIKNLGRSVRREGVTGIRGIRRLGHNPEEFGAVVGVFAACFLVCC
jgi:hypothetical protein